MEFRRWGRGGDLVSVLSGNHTNHINIEENETAVGSIWLCQLSYIFPKSTFAEVKPSILKRRAHELHITALDKRTTYTFVKIHVMNLEKRSSIWPHSANIWHEFENRKKKVQVLHMTTLVLHN
jgi:hypothetical protein